MARHVKAKKEIDGLMEGFLSYAIARSSAIRRYSTEKVLVDQNDMEHMGSVAMIAMLLSDYLNKIGVRNETEKVMRIAITHDLDEVVSGDVPHAAKYKFGEHSVKLRKALERLSEKSVESMYAMIRHPGLSKGYMKLYREQKARKSVESKIAKLADYIDVIIYCTNEMRMGNKDLGRERDNALKDFNRMLDSVLDRHMSGK